MYVNVKCVDIQQGHIQFKTDSKCQVTVLTFSSSLFLHQVLKMTPFCSYTGGESRTPLIYRFVYDVLSNAVPHTQQALPDTARRRHLRVSRRPALALQPRSYNPRGSYLGCNARTGLRETRK